MKHMEERGKKVNLKNLLRFLVVTILVAIFAVTSYLVLRKTNVETALFSQDSELLRAMNYEQFLDGDENVEGTDNVKFSAFFLRDLDGDGYAEKIKGTCRAIGSKDTLYMEIIVQTGGYLKNGKIQIDGKNFYLQTVLPKDNEIKDNYIGNNVKIIEFEPLSNGTQKLLTGVVKSGDYTYSSQMTSAIGNNTNNYSRNDNRIILTGTYVNENNEECEINKTINLQMDWYGTTSTNIGKTYQSFYNLNDILSGTSETISLDFSIYTNELRNQLILRDNHVEATIPTLNGVEPTDVIVKNSNTRYSFDRSTSKLYIDREAKINGNGVVTSVISRDNKYDVTIKYPKDAFENSGEESIELLIPIEEFYEGYNNPNTEFINPYKSNIAKTTIRAVYKVDNSTGATETEQNDDISITVGKYIYSPYSSYVISKRKPMRIYNGVSEVENDDTYIVKWHYSKGNKELGDKIVLKESLNGGPQLVDEFIDDKANCISMNDTTTNIGIYFSNLKDIISDEGMVVVYDNDTQKELLKVASNEFSKYSVDYPFMFEEAVKHIRVEVTGMKDYQSMDIYSIKELDDEYITNEYELEEFLGLKYIKSNLVAYRGEILVGNKNKAALYEIPASVATISLNKDSISTQKTEENEQIIIVAENDINKYEIGWLNGIFLVKIPDEILTTDIKNVEIDNDKITIESVEYIENEKGKFIKIYTSNEEPEQYTITIDCHMTPDPRIPTCNKEVELYSINEEQSIYYFKDHDLFDLNGNLNTDEYVNNTHTIISLISPNSLLTNQTASQFDETGTVIVSPQKAELKPIYGDDDREKQTVKIGVQMKNNYANTISEVLILGKIPFEGNTYVLSRNNLNSEFSTEMKNTGIEVPEELKNKVTVYYSENIDPSKDLQDSSNGWTLKENVQDWSKIKSYIIDFEDGVINPGAEYTFYYIVEIPFGVDFNKTAYSHHGVYFCLDTPEGKYRTSTEPNRIGIIIAEKYNLLLTKYQTNRDIVIPQATYRINKLGVNGEIEENKTAVTNSNGMLEIDNLFAEIEYTIEEIKSPSDYELSMDSIRIIGHVNRSTGELTIEVLDGTIKGNVNIIKNNNEDYKVGINVEDQVKARLKIIKKDKDTDIPLRGVQYRITGHGFNSSGKRLVTNAQGEINLTGIKLDSEYKIDEIKANNYYLNKPIVFKIIEVNNTFQLLVKNPRYDADDINGIEPEFIVGEIGDLNIKNSTVEEENGVPIATFEIKDEKIPKFDLSIKKVEKGTDIEVVGAKFELIKDGKRVGIYETNQNGIITIGGLNQYNENYPDINQTYTLREVFAPEGLSKVKDISFKVQTITESIEENGIMQEVKRLVLNEILEQNQIPKTYSVDGDTVTITIEDNPAFKLIKKDGETNEILPNTKFAIYNVENEEVPAKNSKGEYVGEKEVINGKEYYVVTTNESGEINLDLPEGIYRAIELKADEKYDIEYKGNYFGINASREGKGKAEVDWVGRINKTYATNSWYKLTVGGTESIDDGYYIAGSFYSKINLVGYGSIYTRNSRSECLVIKYNLDNSIKWIKHICAYDVYWNTSGINLSRICKTNDNGVVVVVEFYNSGNPSLSNIDFGDNIKVKTGSGRNYAIVKYSENGDVEWYNFIYGSSSDSFYINGIAGMEDGGVLAAGYLGAKSVNIGNNLKIMNSVQDDSRTSDGMLIKYDIEGNIEWTKTIGNEGDESLSSITKTSDGGCIIGGSFTSNTINFEEGISISNNGDKDAMILKISDTGNIEWTKVIGESETDTIKSIIVDDEGYTILGSFSNVNLDENTYISGTNKTVMVRYNEDFTVDWHVIRGISKMIKTEDGGYLTTGGGDITDENGDYVQSNGSVIVKYNNRGKVEFVKSVPISLTGYFAELDNNEYLFTATKSTSGAIVDFGNGITHVFDENRNDYSVIIRIKETEIDRSVIKYAKRYGSSNSSVYYYDVCPTNDNGYIVAGAIQKDGIARKNDSNGNIKWTTYFKDNSETVLTTISKTIDGGCIVGGYFKGQTINIGNSVVINNKLSGKYDGIMAKLDSNGKVKWATSIGGTANDYVRSVVETSDGGYLVGIDFNSTSINLGNGNIVENKGSDDVLIVKFNSNNEIEWYRVIGDTGSDTIKSVYEGANGHYLIGGNFKSSKIQLDESTDLSLGDGLSQNAMIIEYTSNGEVIFSKRIPVFLNSAIKTSDNGFVIGGRFSQEDLNLGNNVVLNNPGFSDSTAGMVLKYDSYGRIVWGRAISESENDRSDLVYDVSETTDRGIIITGYTNRGNFHTNNINLGNDVTLTQDPSTQSGTNSYVVKYNSIGDTQWAYPVGGIGAEFTRAATELENGSYVVVGHFNSKSIYFKKPNITINKVGSVDGMTIKITEEAGVPEIEELLVENFVKQFKITTEVKPLDGVKGGTISGENAKPYEIVRYGDNSVKEIKMIPNKNYEIVEISINGEKTLFNVLDDGTCVLPQFTNVMEDKHVVVKYSAKNNNLTINKIDGKTKEGLSGAQFELMQIDGNGELVNGQLLGELVNDGIINNVVDKDSEVIEKIGTIVPNGEEYFAEENGKYVPTNSTPFQISIGENAGKEGCANSYIPIDLSNCSGKYKVVVNASISSKENHDYGYAIINESVDAPSYNELNGRFILISGTVESKDYESTILLEGGKSYYLHLGYYKDSNEFSGTDQFVVNSVKLFATKELKYGFIKTDDNKYENTNQEETNTICTSYIPLDLRGFEGNYILEINAEMSGGEYDDGYLIITNNSNRQLFSQGTSKTIHLSGNQEAKEYQTMVEGGKKYYIHLGYDNNSTENGEEDKIIINSINVYRNDSNIYSKVVETNTRGTVVTRVPFGKYVIKEIKAPDGYALSDSFMVINYTADGEHEFDIENDKICNIKVHHYIKGTTEKVAEDEDISGKEGESYTTLPKLDLPDYELEKDENGNYVMPENYKGEFMYDNQDVIYYYTNKEALLTVNHLIEGTTEPVKLINGEDAQAERTSGSEGEIYTTNALTPEELSEKYELAEEEMPENAEGTYEYDEVIVNYYYKIRKFNITTEVEEYEKTNILGETELIRGGSISGENMAPYEKVEYDENSVEDIFIEPDPGYVIKNIKVNDEPIDFEPEPDGTVMLSKFMSVRRNINVAVSFDKDVSQVVVHHYLEGTTDKVPSIYGGVVEDETKKGSIGDPYATKPTNEISERYEVVGIPDNASGTYGDTTTEVTYYYREVPAKVITNHLIVDTNNPVPLNNGTLAQSSTEDGYVTKPYTTEPLTDIDDEYVLVGDSGNTTGNMTKEDTIVNYYYAPKAYAKVNYIVVNSDDSETILETIDYEGYDKEVYTSHSKDFTGYTLTDVPEHETYPLSKDAVTVFNYYYKKNTGLVEKHVDLYTEEIKETEEHDGIVGQEYQIDRRVYDGYKIATNKKYYEKLAKDNPEILSTNSVETVDELLEALGLNGNDPYIPKNYKGALREEPIEVVYYYVKEAKVIVEYHDINEDDPTNPIHPDDVVPGLEKDPYKVEPIDIDGYDLVTDPDYTPTNSEGEMDRDDTIVKYYYVYKTDVVVNYIDISNESKIDSDKKEGHEKDLYKMDQMDLTEHPNYRIVTNQEYYEWLVGKDSSILEENGVTTVGELLAKLELGALDPYIPANYKGEMTKDEIVVNYYYKKQAKVTVKHIDEATGTVLKTEEATYDVGDTYTTGPETIENYTLNEDKLPGNATGDVKDEGVEVKYFYNKKQTPADPTPGGNTPTPTPDPTPTPQPNPEPGPGPAPAPAPQPSQPEQTTPKTTAQRIFSKVLPRTGDTTVQMATSVILMVVLLNMLVTDKVNQGPSIETKEKKHKKKKVQGKRFK